MSFLQDIANAARGFDRVVPVHAEATEGNYAAANRVKTVPAGAAAGGAVVNPLVIDSSAAAKRALEAMGSKGAYDGAAVQSVGRADGLDGAAVASRRANRGEPVIDGEIVVVSRQPAMGLSDLRATRDGLRFSSGNDELSETGEAQMMRLQMYSDRASKYREALGHLLRKQSDASDEITRNIK